MNPGRVVPLAVLVGVWSAALPAVSGSGGDPSKDSSTSPVARAQVWLPTDVSSFDMKTGPKAPNGFAFLAPVSCTYAPKRLEGTSPKFACLLGKGKDDQVKVKYGGD